MTITLPITLRDKSIKLETLRKNGEVPAVVYGANQESLSVSMEAKVFDKVVKEAGESTIIELTGLKNPLEVLIKEVDFNPIKGQINHVDFYVVDKGKEMTTHVTLHFSGEAPAEKTGLINKVMHEIEVTCLPKDLPNHLDVDLSLLVEVGSKILVKDLLVAKGVKINAHDDDVVVIVSPQNEEEVDEVVVTATPNTPDATTEKAE